MKLLALNIISLFTILLNGCKESEKSLHPSEDKMRQQYQETRHSRIDLFQTYRLAQLLPDSASSDQLKPILDSLILEFYHSTKNNVNSIYQAIHILRKQPNIIRSVQEKYETDTGFHVQLTLLSFAGEMQREDAFNFLKGIIWAPLTDTFTRSDKMSKFDFQNILKQKAVDGLAFIRDDSGEMQDSTSQELIRIINNHPLHSVRVEAIDAYLWNHNDNTLEAEKFTKQIPDNYKRYLNRTRFYKGRNLDSFQRYLEKSK